MKMFLIILLTSVFYQLSVAQPSLGNFRYQEGELQIFFDREGLYYKYREYGHNSSTDWMICILLL